MFSLSHITLEVCISAAGQILPSMVIFEGNLPLVTGQEGWPEDWLYARSENGAKYYIFF